MSMLLMEGSGGAVVNSSIPHAGEGEGGGGGGVRGLGNEYVINGRKWWSSGEFFSSACRRGGG